jgi:hypothetical protein
MKVESYFFFLVVFLATFFFAAFFFAAMSFLLEGGVSCRQPGDYMAQIDRATRRHEFFRPRRPPPGRRPWRDTPGIIDLK